MRTPSKGGAISPLTPPGLPTSRRLAIGPRAQRRWRCACRAATYLGIQHRAHHCHRPLFVVVAQRIVQHLAAWGGALALANFRARARSSACACVFDMDAGLQCAATVLRALRVQARAAQHLGASGIRGLLREVRSVLQQQLHRREIAVYAGLCVCAVGQRATQDDATQENNQRRPMRAARHVRCLP